MKNQAIIEYFLQVISHGCCVQSSSQVGLINDIWIWLDKSVAVLKTMWLVTEDCKDKDKIVLYANM
jgi:hypothetical protein